jgi:hypothetical protein
MVKLAVFASRMASMRSVVVLLISMVIVTVSPTWKFTGDCLRLSAVAS